MQLIDFYDGSGLCCNPENKCTLIYITKYYTKNLKLPVPCQSVCKNSHFRKWYTMSSYFWEKLLQKLIWFIKGKWIQTYHSYRSLNKIWNMRAPRGCSLTHSTSTPPARANPTKKIFALCPSALLRSLGLPQIWT